MKSVFFNSLKTPSQQFLNLTNVSFIIVYALLIHVFRIFFPDTSFSLALPPLNGFNESYFDQDHFMFLCSDFNMTFTGSPKRTNDSQTE